MAVATRRRRRRTALLDLHWRLLELDDEHADAHRTREEPRHLRISRDLLARDCELIGVRRACGHERHRGRRRGGGLAGVAGGAGGARGDGRGACVDGGALRLRSVRVLGGEKQRKDVEQRHHRLRRHRAARQRAQLLDQVGRQRPHLGEGGPQRRQRLLALGALERVRRLHPFGGVLTLLRPKLHRRRRLLSRQLLCGELKLQVRLGLGRLLQRGRSCGDLRV